MAPFPSLSSSSPPTDESASLIPGLPNEIAAQVLSFVPYSHHSRLKATSKAWRAFFSSQTLISIRHRHFHLTHLLCIFPHGDSIPSPYLFDPQNLAWRPLPPMPCKYELSGFSSVSVGPNLYVLGGSIFDSRRFPFDHVSSSVFRFNFVDSSWGRLSPMLSPRQSFACAAIPHLGQIIVAAGGSRHTLFVTEDRGMSSVERYDIERDEWVTVEGLSMDRVECEGFSVRKGEESEFWVVGGYVESDEEFVDEFCTAALVLDVKRNEIGKWRKIGHVLQEGERGPGKIVAVEDYGIFMVENGGIFRYNMASNMWEKESTVPRKAPNSTCGFVELDGELHVMTPLKKIKQKKSVGTLLVQIYNLRRKTWRSLTTHPPFNKPLDFDKAVMCTVRL